MNRQRTGTRRRVIEAWRRRFMEDGFAVTLKGTLKGKKNAAGADIGIMLSRERLVRGLSP